MVRSLFFFSWLESPVAMLFIQNFQNDLSACPVMTQQQKQVYVLGSMWDYLEEVQEQILTVEMILCESDSCYLLKEFVLVRSDYI